MKSLGIRQAKAHLSSLVRAASKGECSLVTDNGKLVAMIAPPPDAMLAEAPMQSADDAPPLVDEAPSLFDEASAPVDEAPPLTDESPPLDEALPPFDEAPPADEAPPLFDEVSPPADEAPPPFDKAPPLTNAAAFRDALLSAPYPLELDF